MLSGSKGCAVGEAVVLAVAEMVVVAVLAVVVGGAMTSLLQLRGRPVPLASAARAEWP